jgi:hypothetical protein
VKIIPFEELYYRDFFISDPISKPQNWHSRGNIYNALGKPKLSHTLLWFKNCSATITDSHGNAVGDFSRVSWAFYEYLQKGRDAFLSRYGDAARKAFEDSRKA